VDATAALLRTAGVEIDADTSMGGGAIVRRDRVVPRAIRVLDHARSAIHDTSIAISMCAASSTSVWFL
jgi:hypothetical protein